MNTAEQILKDAQRIYNQITKEASQRDIDNVFFDAIGYHRDAAWEQLSEIEYSYLEKPERLSEEDVTLLKDILSYIKSANKTGKLIQETRKKAIV